MRHLLSRFTEADGGGININNRLAVSSTRKKWSAIKSVASELIQITLLVLGSLSVASTRRIINSGRVLDFTLLRRIFYDIPDGFNNQVQKAQHDVA